MQSDDLDEIDWEWLGANNALVQTNYFGKGDTSSYSRGGYHDNPGNHDGFHTYSIDWTSEQIVWAIDGTTVRVLTPATAETNQYPQTPMMIKVGVWAGGDPRNAQGTIGESDAWTIPTEDQDANHVVDWAGGLTDYSQGPFTMYLKSLAVTDYSTGNLYSYSDRSGSWQSIVALGGKVDGNSAAEPAPTESAPAVTATVDSAPIPWEGTHMETSSHVTPDIWPWVATASPTASPSFPSGWESSSGHIKPPRGGSVSEHTPAPSSTPLESITKTGSRTAQSTFRSTSVPLVSSSGAFSRSGLETPRISATRHTISTSLARTTAETTTSKTTSAETESETETFAMGPDTTTPTLSNSSLVAPSKNAGVNMHEVPALLGSLCGLFVGIVALL